MTKGRASSNAHMPSSLALGQRLTGDILPALPPAADILTIQQMDKAQPATSTPISPLPTSSVLPSQPNPSTLAGLKPVPPNSIPSTLSSAPLGVPSLPLQLSQSMVTY